MTSVPTSPSRPPPPPRPPRPGNNGCVVVLLVLLGVAMLLPGICAVLFVLNDPKILRNSRDGEVVWQFLGVGIAGVAIIILAIKSRRR